MTRVDLIDPLLPLKRAVLLERVWGTISILLGAVAMGPLTYLIAIKGRPVQFGHVLYLVAVLITSILPGALYWVLSIYQQRRRRWAITLGLIAASGNALCALLGTAALGILVLTPRQLFILLPMLCAIIFSLGCVQIIYYLARSYSALARVDDQARGLEPVNVLRSTRPE